MVVPRLVCVGRRSVILVEKKGSFCPLWLGASASGSVEGLLSLEKRRRVLVGPHEGLKLVRFASAAMVV